MFIYAVLTFNLAWIVISMNLSGKFRISLVSFLWFEATKMQLLSSQDVNWWTGVVWITCGLLWCFYQLFGLSFWRHPFTAEHPLLSKWWHAAFLQICSDEETNSSTSRFAWGWAHFQLIFGWTLPLMTAAQELYKTWWSCSPARFENYAKKHLVLQV